MTLEERLTTAAHGLADGLVPPDVDLDAVRRRAHVNRRRTVALVATAAVVGGIIVATATGIGRETSAPLPPVAPRPTGSAEPGPQQSGSCESVPYVERLPATSSTESDLQAWIDDLPVGAPPVTPYWHDGVLHAGGVEIEASYRDVDIDTAGSTVLVTGWDDVGRNARPSEFALVRGDQLDPLPVPPTAYPQLSTDGRIAYWSTHPTDETTRVDAWDTETNTSLASRTLAGNEDQEVTDPTWCVVTLLGVDADGIGYLLDEASDPQITRWDIRADTLEPTDLTFDRSMTFSEQFDFGWNATQGFEAAYVSPDGTREVFTGPASGDSTPDCCSTQIRVRPVGPAESLEPGDVVPLQLPEGIPSMGLWDSYSDRGTWGVWWETNDSVLVDAEVEGNSHLVRCPTNGGECELVFDLGPNSSRDVLYEPDWEREWGFARLPVTG